MAMPPPVAKKQGPPVAPKPQLVKKQPPPVAPKPQLDKKPPPPVAPKPPKPPSSQQPTPGHYGSVENNFEEITPYSDTRPVPAQSPNFQPTQPRSPVVYATVKKRCEKNPPQFYDSWSEPPTKPARIPPNLPSRTYSASSENNYELDSPKYFDPWSPSFPALPSTPATNQQGAEYNKNRFSKVSDYSLPTPPHQQGDEYNTDWISQTPNYSPPTPQPNSPQRYPADFPATPQRRQESIYDEIDSPTTVATRPPQKRLPEKFEGFLPMIAKTKRAQTFYIKPEIEIPVDRRKTTAVPTDWNVKPVVANPAVRTEINLFAKRGPEDAYVGSNIVVGLTGGTFKSFLKDVDAAFVLFYDPYDEDCTWAKSGVKSAAALTKRANHVYAGVDCTTEKDLCRKLKVVSFPTMKLYAKGAEVNTFPNNTFMSADEMRLLVEKSPGGSESMPTKSCSIQ